MKRRSFLKCTSVVLALCIMLTCMSFAFTNVGAATSEKAGEKVSAASSDTDSFSWDNASVYFLLTDRFKNGNKSNDHSYGRATDAEGNPLSGWDTAPGTFHGGDFAGITQAINEGYFTDLGINALWISAPYEQIHGYVDSGQGFAHYSYHGYYVLDYTQTDANFGTAQEFETMVDTAHKNGIRVIIDIVMNHTGYNNVKDMEEYDYGTLLSGASEYKYKLNGVGDVNKHIDFSSSASDWGRWWGTQWIRSGLPGYTPAGSSDTTMSLQGLPDFITESNAVVDIPPILKTKWTKEGRLTQETNKLDSYLQSNGKTRTVTNTLAYWLSTWVRDFGVDGFRCDTAKHVDLASWKTLKTTCVDALKQWRSNNPSKPGADWDEDFWMTGECWDHNLGWGYDSYYTQGGFDSMINFETTGGGLLQSNLGNLYNGYANEINSNDKFNQLSYISSHDSTLARGDLIYLGSALMMLPGGIQVFYGDETNRPLVSGLGFDGNGGSGHSLRSDMNWDSIDENVLSHWQKVGTFRNNHISVGAGENISLTATSGTAFGRSYSKNGVSDKIAAVVAAGKNTNITIDVSSLWNDGQGLVNAYDQSSAIVSGGKVTFNSGTNGTILIQEPDGRPLMSIQGEAKFTGTQNVTVNLEECDYAKCSIDGGNKFIVYNGTTFEIGHTAYDGDTIKVVLEAENEKGSAKSVATFTKTEKSSGTDVPGPEPEKAEIHVKTWDGSAPYVYAWTGESSSLCGEWPGTRMTAKDSDGNYVMTFDTTEVFNVVMNSGSGVQSADIKGLNGVTYLEVTDGSYNTRIVSTGELQPTDETIVIHVKTYDGNPVNIYAWNDNGDFFGAWPGKALSEKDSDGNYVVTVPNTSSCNVILNKNGGQTSDITGVSGEVVIEVTNAECTSYKLTKIEKPLSGMPLLRQEAREVKIMTSSDYTASSWNAVNSLMNSADLLIAQGSDADENAVNNIIAQLQSAKKNLVLAQPVISYAVAGKTVISGVSVPDAEVIVRVNGMPYSTVSDDVTGAFSVNIPSLSASATINVNVTRNGVSAAAYSYNMSNGNINGGNVPVTEPTTQQPTAAPTTQPTTAPASEKLIINASSNIFPSASKSVDVSEGTVTVTFRLNANMCIGNAQWVLSYDTSKLRYDASKNKSNGVQTIMPKVGNSLIYNYKSNYIKGTYTNITTLCSFKNEPFVSVTFDILGSGTADVYFDLQYLSLAYQNTSELTNVAYIVDKSKLCDISSTRGFENASIKTDTFIGASFMLGDVDGDGMVTIQDSTAILKHLVELETLSPVQCMAANVDGDDVVSVMDSTKIQMYIAEIISEF